MVPRIGTAARIAAVADLGLRRSRLLDAETLAAGSTLLAHRCGLALVILLLLAGLDLLLAGVGVDDGLAGSLQALGLETLALKLCVALFFARDPLGIELIELLVENLRQADITQDAKDAVNNPVRPFVAILGGSKVSSKISVINNLLDKVDTLIIGGGMSYTFQKAHGGNVGQSLVEDDYLDYAKEMMAKAEAKGVKMLIPIDTVVTKEFSNDAPFHVVEAGCQEDDDMGMDIGPKTCELYKDALKDAKTVVWNGPMGVFEFDNFAKGTIAVAQALAELKDATTIIGGGDSASAVNNLGFGDKMTHISTGGGASLEFLEGKELPGVAAANDR